MPGLDRRLHTCAPSSSRWVPEPSSLEWQIGKRIKPLANGCWLFGNGSLDTYANTKIGGTVRHVTRVLLEALQGGPLPEDAHVHHVCLNPGCVNPAHLEVLSAAEHAK